MNIENVNDAFINQAGRDIIVNNGLIEQLHQSCKRFDFIEASGQVDSIKRMMNVSDSFEISFDSANPSVFKITPQKSEENPEGIVCIKATLAVPKEYGKFSDFNKLMTHLYFEQKKLNAKAVRFSAFAGEERLFCHEKEIKGDYVFFETELTSKFGMDISVKRNFNNIFKEKVTIMPAPFPPPISCMLESGTMISGINLFLGLEKIEDKGDSIQYHLSNKGQNIPLKFSFKVNIPQWSRERDVSAEVRYNFSIDEEAKKYHKVILSRLIISMEESQKFILRDVSTGKIICEGTGIQLSEQDYDYFCFWNLIGEIDNIFGVNLELPREITKQEWLELNNLSMIIKTGKKAVGFDNFTAKIDNHATIRNIISNSGSGQLKIENNSEEVIELFGSKLELGTRLLVTPPMKLLDKDILQEKLKLVKDGEEIEVKFAPVKEDGKILLIYPKFCKANEQMQIMM